MAEFRAPAKQEYPHRGQGTKTREQTGGIQGPGAGGRQQRAKTLGESGQLLKNQVLLKMGRKFLAEFAEKSHCIWV
jgi:hypothetical protein